MNPDIKIAEAFLPNLSETDREILIHLAGAGGGCVVERNFGYRRDTINRRFAGIFAATCSGHKSGFGKCHDCCMDLSNCHDCRYCNRSVGMACEVNRQVTDEVEANRCTTIVPGHRKMSLC